MKTILEHVQERSIEHISDLAGKRVLLRLDLNTSLGENGTVDEGEDWRIIKALPTIQYLIDAGARVIAISHIGREPQESLKPVYVYMSEKIAMGFIPKIIDPIVTSAIENMQHGSVILLENLRQDEREKSNDAKFAQDLAGYADLYVNEAFSVSHREHASVHAVTQLLPSYFGLQFVDEIEHLDKASTGSEQSLLLLGGAKFGTKMDLLHQFLPKVHYALVGGALANVFLRERGFEIGKSFADDVDISSMVNNEKIIVPVDCVDQHGDVISIDHVGPEDMILDIGPETEKLFKEIINTADTVLWNGPMGKYEDGYVSGSVDVADAIANSGAFSITGGGDTATVILEQDLENNFNFISTGGGAMLDFLVEGSLPAIDVIIGK